ncbi:MAG: dTDP-4-dehydrorhamnose reductase [Deltaproteobacteria bacterium]|nr:dTDP-4-dehydrorhamnose reductase [Deltaproteobacteria bacterium]
MNGPAMRVAVIGSLGMLGQDLIPRLEKAGFEAIGLDLLGSGSSRLDITQPEAVLSLLKTLSPELVINCAAYTAVDQAESEPEKAMAVNRDGPAHVADACAALAIPLVHLSTDYVFDGRLNRPYREDDPAHPLNAYGWSKWQGEEAIRSRLPAHLIIRTSWLYGVHGHNFVKTILRKARAGEDLRVVADQFGSPTWTGDLADALVAMTKGIQTEGPAVKWGTYHFCGGGYTTWHGFAQAIVDEAHRRGRLGAVRVSPVSSAEFQGPARRPPWSVLDCRKAAAAFNLTPRPWRQGLRDMLAELFHIEA